MTTRTGIRVVILTVAFALCVGLVPWLDVARAFQPRRTVAVVCRDQNSISEKVIVACLQDLIDEHNSGTPELPLALELHYSRKGLDLETIFRQLSTREDVVALIDNSWRADLESRGVASLLAGLPHPIVFLNADRFTETREKPWVFLGASDHIPGQLAELYLHALARLRPSRARLPAQTVFLSEYDDRGVEYQAAADVHSAIEAAMLHVARETAEPDPPHIPKIAMRCAPGWLLKDRNAVTTVRSELLAKCPDHANDNPKLIVTHCHADWGTELFRWIDDSFRNTTILTYQSASNRDRPIRLRAGTGNRIVMLSQDAAATPERLHRLRSVLRDRRPDLFTEESADLFYMRRAVAGFELIVKAIRDGSSDGLDASTNESSSIRTRAARYMWSLHGRAVPSSLGFLTFDKQGVERGNNHTILRKEDAIDSYPMQFNGKDRPIPNLQILVSDVTVLDLNIRDDCARVAFTLTVRCDSQTIIDLFAADSGRDEKRGAGGVSSQPPTLDEALSALLQFDKLDHSDYVRSLLSSQRFDALTELRYAISGKFRLNALQPWWYPFDRQRVTVPIRTTMSRESIRLSMDQRQLAANEHSQRTASPGWTPRQVSVTVGNSSDATAFGVTSPPSLPDGQFSTILVELMMRRRPWSAFVLVYMPLLLIVLGSTAVLFLRFGVPTSARKVKDDKDKSTDAARAESQLVVIGEANALFLRTVSPIAPSNSSDETNEVIKTQSELCLGCVLAAVTYLISYSGLVPRMEKPLYCDALLGATLVLTTANFIFVVSIADRDGHPFLKYWSMERYGYASALLAALFFGFWPAIGLYGVGTTP